MQVGELIKLLQECDERAEVEVAFILHSMPRTLMPGNITVVNTGDTDDNGDYHWTCIIDLWEF